MDYTIRLATEDDTLGLSRLKYQMWEENYRGIYPEWKFEQYDEDEQQEKFNHLILDPNIQLFVVELDTKLIGYMSFGTPYRTFGDYQQEIGLLYLLRKYHHHGIGKELFMLAKKAIKDKGYTEFFVSCNKYNQLGRTFYEKMGGVIIHEDLDDEDRSTVQVKFHFDIEADVI